MKAIRLIAHPIIRWPEHNLVSSRLLIEQWYTNKEVDSWHESILASKKTFLLSRSVKYIYRHIASLSPIVKLSKLYSFPDWSANSSAPTLLRRFLFFLYHYEWGYCYHRRRPALSRRRGVCRRVLEGPWERRISMEWVSKTSTKYRWLFPSRRWPSGQCEYH